MKIRFARLNRLLAPYGFHVSKIGTNSLTFFRPDSLLGLFQKIHIDCQGKSGEAVYGNVSASVVRFLHLKIDIRLHLKKLDLNNERNWTIVESDSAAMVWEKRFAEIAPPAAEACAREYGDELLERTAHARQRSSQVLSYLDPDKSFFQSIQEFRATHGPGFIDEAVRLAEWPGVMQVYEANEVYLLACCGILSSEEWNSFVGEDPLKNDVLMWLIQLVVDGILSWSKEAKQ